MSEKGLGSLGTCAFYAVELAHEGTLAAAVAVVGDTEAVSLVAQVLHHAQSLAVLVDIQRHAVAGEVNLLQSLCYADNGYGTSQAHLFKSFYSTA